MLHAMRGSTIVSAVLIVVVGVDLAVGQRCVDNAENRGRGFFDPDNCNNNCDDGGNIPCCAHDSHFEAYDPLSCPNDDLQNATGTNDSGQDGGGTPPPGTGGETEPTSTPDTPGSNRGANANTDGSVSPPEEDGSTPTIVGVVLGCLVLFVIIFALVYSHRETSAMLPVGADGDQGDGAAAANRAHFENPMYGETIGAVVGSSKAAAGSLVDAVPNQIAGGASTYAAVDEAGPPGTDTSESIVARADYETVGAAQGGGGGA
eukprot:gene25503-15942_t